MDLGETTTALVDSAVVAAENIIPRVGDVITRLGEAIGEKAPEISEKLGSLFYNSVPPEFQQTLDDLGSRLSDVAKHWEPIIGKMQELADIVAPKVGEVLKYIYDNALTQALLPALGNLGDAIGHIMDAMKDWVGPIMNVAGIVGNALVGALGIAINIIAAAIDIIADIMNALKDFCHWIEDTGKTIGNFANDAGKFFGDLGKGIEDTVKGAIDWFTHLPDNILKALGNLGKLLFESGKDIIQGLIDGLLNSPTAVLDTLTGIANDAVNGFKNFFGIASPSKLMRKLGGWTMEGYAEGLEDFIPDIGGIMSDVTGIVSGDVPQIGVGSPVAYAGNAPINIYMTYNAGEDAKELVYDMVGQLRRYGYTMGGKR